MQTRSSTKTYFTRPVPPGWRVVPREMLFWTTPTWGSKKTCVDLETLIPARVDQVEGTKNTKSRHKNPFFTYNPAATVHPSSHEPQKLLSVFDLRVLSELIEQLRVQKKTVDDVLLFKPADLLKPIGLQLSGSSYRKIEQSLIDLATFRVQTSLDTSETEYLLSFMDTGFEQVSTGAQQRSNQGGKRHLYWRVQFGKLLQRLLRHSSLFVSYPISVFQEAGRSPTAQWLCLFYFSHGHDGNLIYDHNLTTLAEKAHLPEQVVARMKLALEKEAKARNLDPLDVQAKLERTYARSKRTAALRVRKCFSRLSKSSIFQFSGIKNASDSDPSIGQVSVRRFGTNVEAFLSQYDAQMRQMIRAGRSFLSRQYARLLLVTGSVKHLRVSPFQPVQGWCFNS